MTEGHYESKTNYAQIQFTTVDDLLRKVVITFNRFFFQKSTCELITIHKLSKRYDVTNLVLRGWSICTEKCSLARSCHNSNLIQVHVTLSKQELMASP